MSRPSTIDDSVILQSAQELFLKHGFKTSTAQIARKAGVSEGSIFRRYKNKVDLFLTAMDMKEKDKKWQDQLKKYRPGRDDARVFLAEAAHALISHMERMIPKFMALRASGLKRSDMKKIFAEPPPMIHLRVLTGFFSKLAAEGLVRSSHPETQAHAFQGALMHYVMGRHNFDYIPQKEKEYVEELLNIHLPKASDRGDS